MNGGYYEEHDSGDDKKEEEEEEGEGEEERRLQEPQGLEDLCLLIKDSQERIRRHLLSRESEQSVLS